MSLSDTPKLIEAGIATDARGQVVFANDFDMSDVKRFYIVGNSSLDIIRAWHGHAKEAKYVFVVSGEAIIAAVKLDDLEKPNKENIIHKHIISSEKPAIFYVPGGYANGFRALVPNTTVIFFSTSTLEESKGDDYRFSADYWGEDVWK